MKKLKIVALMLLIGEVTNAIAAVPNSGRET